MAILGFSVFAPTAGATDNPTTFDGNPTCTDLGFSAGLKIDAQPTAGVYAAGSAHVEIEGTVREDLEIAVSDVVVADTVTFDWHASVDDGDDDGIERDDFFIDAVLVKFADGGLRWSYAQPGASSGTAWSEKDSVSHVTFCFDDDAGGGTGGTTDNGTTDNSTDGTDNGTTTGGTDNGTTGGTDSGNTTGGTTDNGTRGGTDGGTTTDGSSTDSVLATTTGGTDTGGTGAAVLGNTVTRGATAEPTSSASLPVTGSDDLTLAVGGASLIALGAGALVTSQRARRHEGEHLA